MPDKSKPKLGDKRKCWKCKTGIQILRPFIGFYNIWKCFNSACRQENLEEK